MFSCLADAVIQSIVQPPSPKSLLPLSSFTLHPPPLQVTFVYFICNALWLVATFFLQLICSSVTIKIPKASLNLTATGEYVYIDPIGLMFLLGFGLLILIQFLAMLYHR